MKTISRALKATVRSPLRSALVVAVLAVSVGLALIMITVNQAFAKRLDQIKGQAGTNITVRPAGSFGGGFFGRGGGDGGGANAQATPSTGSADQTPPTLTNDDVSKLLTLPHIASVSSNVTVRYTGTDLVAPTPEASNNGGGFGGFAGDRQRPILITGTDSPTSLSTVGTNDAQITAGSTFTSDQLSQNVAVVGQTLAQANNLSVGSTFPLNGATMQVVGLFSTGTQFGDDSIFLPLATTQSLFQRTNEIDSAVVHADSVDNVSSVADSIRSTLGATNVDVVTELSVFENIASPLSDAKSSSRIGMIAALIGSAAVILFSIGLVARQRIKEIGILKAVGASIWHVTGQFAVETSVLSVSAALIGALATFPLAQSVANSLVSQPSTPTFGGGGRAGLAFTGGRAAARGFFGGTTGSNLLGDIGVAVSPDVFLYALAIAVGLALIASVVPAWYVSRVKPAEVLRHE